MKLACPSLWRLMASTKTCMVEAKYSKKDALLVQRLVAELTSLREPEKAMARLLPYGTTAIRALRDYLLNSRPSGVYQPRQWVVYTLAELGARSVLLEYLQKPQYLDDPVTRFGEEAVQSTAARELARWKDNETFTFLMAFAREDRRTGAIEALAEYERPEAAPVFISALEDDFYRPPAIEGLRRLGRKVKPHLIRAAFSKSDYHGSEPPWSVRRRAAALTLLKDAGPDESDWRKLKILSRDEHPEVAVGLACIVIGIGNERDRERSARQIIRTYPSGMADSRTRKELEDCLMRLQPEAAIAVSRALERNRFRSNKSVVERFEYLLRKMQSV
jgi:HEAT repeat protein